MLNQYVQAVTDGNMGGVKAVRQFKNAGEEKTFSGSIKAMRGLGCALQNCSAPVITGDAARVICDIALIASKDTKPNRATFLLSRVNGHWLIVPSE